MASPFLACQSGARSETFWSRFEVSLVRTSHYDKSIYEVKDFYEVADDCTDLILAYAPVKQEIKGPANNKLRFSG